MQPDNPLELEDGVDLDPLCPVCNDTGVLMVREAGVGHSDDLAEYEPCPCRWER